MTTQYTEALIYAEAMHFGQVRRFTGEPYVVHPLRVARAMQRYGFGHGTGRVKAVLHDTFEDTDATLEDIRERFGADVAASVYRLSDPNVNTPISGLTKQEKLVRYGEHIWEGTATDHNIKLLDIQDNVPSMVYFAKHAKALSYVREKKFFLRYLTKGCVEVYTDVKRMLDEQEAFLIAL